MEEPPKSNEALAQYKFQRVESHEIQAKDLNECYNIISVVGQGTYGTVYKASSKANPDQICAIKYIDTSRELEGFPITALREIKLLQGIKHENILNIIEIVIKQSSLLQNPRSSTFIVLDYMDHDLNSLIFHKIKFTLPEIKCLALQLLKGLMFLHSKSIVHRDLKPANLLLNSHGVLKIADFGLAKVIKKPSNRFMTIIVVTLWYRAPEILLGNYYYDEKIDVWSVGCILYEIMTGKPLFPSENETQQIRKIIEVCGYPDEETWPEIQNFKNKSMLNDIPKSECKLKEYLEKNIPDIDEYSCLFLQQLLSLNPSQRLSAEEAVNHIYFQNEPLPVKPSEIQKIQHELPHYRRSSIQKKDAENPNKQDYLTTSNKQFYNSQKPNTYYRQNQYNNNQQYQRKNNYRNNFSQMPQSKYEQINKKPRN